MSRVFQEQLRTINCPVCGKQLKRQNIDDDTDFNYSDYYCNACEINITVYCYLNEEEEL